MLAKDISRRRAPANDDRPGVDNDGARNLSKVTPPTLHRVHPNRRLFRQVEDCSAPIIWIHGPPGAGKTTLAASYLAAVDIEPLWYRLDAGDADPATLFVYLGAAWQGRKVGMRLPQLTSSSPPDLPLFTRRFFRGLFACHQTKVVVFDDYHEVAADSALHQCLAHGLEEIPQGCRVVIVSRAPPPPALARLRMNGLLNVIEPDALRLQFAEAEGLVLKRGADVAAARIGTMLQKVQGWTAGLILMVEAGADFDTTTGDASERLFDYFASEILQRMPAERQRLLTILSLMPLMTAATAEALTGSREAARLLEDLRKRNYFTTRDTAAEPRYRFHPLFRDFLVGVARDRLSSDDLKRLLMQAADVLEAEDPESAFALLKEAGDAEAMVCLIKRVASSLIDAGRHATLMSWIASVPAVHFKSDPWLNYWAGMANRYLKPANAILPMQTAFALFESAGDVSGQYAAWAGEADMVRSDAYGDMTRLDPLIDRLRTLMSKSPLPQGPVAMNVAIVMAVALARRSGDRAEIALWQDRAMAISQAVPGGYWARMLDPSFAINDMHDGNYASARRRMEGKVVDVDNFDGRIVDAAVFIASAMMRLYRQTPGDCVDDIEPLVQAMERSGYIAWAHTLAGIAATDVCRRCGDPKLARTWLQRMGAYDDRHSPERHTFYHAVAAQVEILSGNLQAALEEATIAVAKGVRHGWYYYEGLARLIRCDVLIRMRRFDGADHELSELDRVLACSATQHIAVSAGLFKAELSFCRDDASGGAAHLAQALALSRQQDARSLGGVGDVTGRLCAKALRLGIEPDYLRTLIPASGIPAPDPHDEAWPWPLAIRTLGGLRVEVDSTPLAFSRKTPKRLILLLKAIVAYGGRDVPEEKLVDAVWPDDDGDAAVSALRIAIHRLRKLLGDANVVTVKAGRVSLDPARCWLDVWSFEHHAARRQPGETDDSFGTRLGRARALYRGDFLAGDDDLPWTSARRERCRRAMAQIAPAHVDE